MDYQVTNRGPIDVPLEQLDAPSFVASEPAPGRAARAPTAAASMASTRIAADEEGDGERPLLTVAEALRTGPEPRRPVVGRIVERGVVTMVAAQPGVGKTTVGIHIACAVATGRSWAGMAVREPGRVIYFNAEDHLEELKRRFAAMEECGEMDAAAAGRIQLFSGEERSLLMDKAYASVKLTGLGELLKRVVVNQRPDLLVVDPLAMVHGLDENSNAEMAQFISYLHEIARQADCGVLVMHHSGKDGKTGLAITRGASALPAAVRSLWQVSVDDQSNAETNLVYLKCVKSNHSGLGRERLFKREAIFLSTGDAVGILRFVEAQPHRDQRSTRAGRRA